MDGRDKPGHDGEGGLNGTACASPQAPGRGDTPARAWLRALEKLLRDGGVPAARARRVAVDAVVRTEGALVIARALRDNAVFVRTVGDVEKLLLEEVDARG